MRLSNIRQIIAEDFPDADKDMVSRLGGILNYFMRQVVELSNNNIDFENMTWDLATIEVTVDANGSPVTQTKFSTDINSPRGLQVIRAQNLTNIIIYPTNQPFISYTPEGSGIIRLDNVTGLQANNKYRLTVVVV